MKKRIESTLGQLDVQETKKESKILEKSFYKPFIKWYLIQEIVWNYLTRKFLTVPSNRLLLAAQSSNGCSWWSLLVELFFGECFSVRVCIYRLVRSKHRNGNCIEYFVKLESHSRRHPQEITYQFNI